MLLLSNMLKEANFDVDDPFNILLFPSPGVDVRLKNRPLLCVVVSCHFFYWRYHSGISRRRIP